MGRTLAGVNLRAVGGRNQVCIVVSAAIRGGGITLTRRAIYRVNRVSASPGLRVRQAAPAGEAIIIVFHFRLPRFSQGAGRGSSTICVCVTMPSNRPCSDVTRVWRTKELRGRFFNL